MTSVPLERTPRGLTSSMASARYRMIIPSVGLERIGWRSRITHVALTANRATLLKRFEGASAVVMGKLAYTDDRNFAKAAPVVLDLAGQLRSAGVRLIADFSDDRTLDPLRGAFDRQVANLVDVAVASTAQLADVIRAISPAPVQLITDPVEGPRGAPTAQGAPAPTPLRLLWFGHWNKIRGLPRALSQLDQAAASSPFALVLVTAQGFGAEQIAEELHEKWRKLGGSCRFRPWTVSAVFEELARCDAVVIPSDPYNPHDAVRSHNRFTESLWAGRFPIAHPLPSYQALADFGWVGEDLGEGLSTFVADRAAARSRVLSGQDYIARHFAPEVVANAWNRVLTDLLERK